MKEEASAKIRLLEEAKKLFACQGFFGVSVREITKNAGTNTAMVSYYFGGKEGLYREILRNAINHIEEHTRELHDLRLSPRKRITSYVRGIIHLHHTQPHCAKILLHEIQHPSHPLREMVLPRITKMARGMQAALEEGQTAGDFRRDVPPHLGAYFVASMVNFYFLQASLVRSIIPELENQDSLLEESVLKVFFEGMEA
ncbi:MAG TPA: TetR family transcriptional regulator [Synergistaceae bacterium]|nr:TetR family transcriptional regulator [Synergistaceae bacterium]HPJ25037.1 TetR family transcriptional regulator [Synergistaceae bacterium]HPQ36677.1 TetR family transcriptional regulator [Synergistaceae bacterium]